MAPLAAAGSVSIEIGTSTVIAAPTTNRGARMSRSTPTPARHLTNSTPMANRADGAKKSEITSTDELAPGTPQGTVTLDSVETVALRAGWRSRAAITTPAKANETDVNAGQRN